MSKSALLSVFMAQSALGGTLFVSNERGNSVSVIDSESMEMIDSFEAGNRPRGITVSPDGKVIYVCASDDDTVKVFDAQSYEHLFNPPSGRDPELFVLAPSGNPLYIANEDDNQVTVVDTEKHDVLGEIPVGVEPEGMEVSPDSKWVINTSETTNMAHFIETTTHEIVYNVLVDQRPRYVEWLDDGSKVYVSSEIGGTVSVIDPNAEGGPVETKTIVFEISGVVPEAIQPVGVAATKAGATVFVALGPANRVAVIDGSTDVVLDYILVGQRVWQLAMSPDEKTLVTTNGNSNYVTFIELAARKVVKSVQVGKQPWGAVWLLE